MTRPIHRKNSARRAVVLAFLGLVASELMMEHRNMGQAMAQGNRLTLWQAITILVQEMPLSKEKLEKALETRLLLKTKNENLIHWTGGGVQLERQLHIREINLVLGPTGVFDSSSGASIEIAGDCISLDQVREHYSNLEITQHPRGRSLQETTVYASKHSWGQLSFAFQEENPDCLLRVSFRQTRKN